MAGRMSLPAAVETPSVWPHLRGRPVLVTTISVSLLLTTSLRVVVQASPRLSVTRIRRSAQLVALGEVGHPLAFEHGAPALVELAGRPPLDGRFLRVGCQGVVGFGRRVWRVGCRGVVGLPVGELVLEGLSDQAAHPGRDVDGFLRAESVELAPHLGVDPEADGGFWWHAAMLR